jgi:hypothetical protein
MNKEERLLFLKRSFAILEGLAKEINKKSLTLKRA